MRKAVVDLISMGQLPSEDNEDISVYDKYQKIIDSISPPISREEANALVLLFGNDGCYGLTSTLVHLIESASDFCINDFNKIENNYGVNILRSRVLNTSKINPKS
ncbi:hypothetical protein [Pseudocitrobacter cyperus]|uniref:Uncharacterized protein n=1 Tax=Pseudocitrobacter cyperus TaxID=3112843 RepID=A0ABV0HEL9_9ENTR